MRWPVKSSHGLLNQVQALVLSLIHIKTGA